MTEIRKKICDIISRMLDNPDESGIYPTTIAYDELEKLIVEKQFEALGWTYAFACNCLDKGIDLRKQSVPNILNQWLKVKK